MFQIKSRKTVVLAAAFLWGFALILLALLPERIAENLLGDKSRFPIAHGIAYAGLAFLLSLYLRFQNRWVVFRRYDWIAVFASLSVSFCFGAVAELAQFFTPDRIPDWADIGSNMLGAISGIAVFYFLVLAGGSTYRIPPARERRGK